MILFQTVVQALHVVKVARMPCTQVFKQQLSMLPETSQQQVTGAVIVSIHASNQVVQSTDLAIVIHLVSNTFSTP